MLGNRKVVILSQTQTAGVTGTILIKPDLPKEYEINLGTFRYTGTSLTNVQLVVDDYLGTDGRVLVNPNSIIIHKMDVDPGSGAYIQWNAYVAGGGIVMFHDIQKLILTNNQVMRALFTGVGLTMLEVTWWGEERIQNQELWALEHYKELSTGSKVWPYKSGW